MLGTNQKQLQTLNPPRAPPGTGAQPLAHADRALLHPSSGPSVLQQRLGVPEGRGHACHPRWEQRAVCPPAEQPRVRSPMDGGSAGGDGQTLHLCNETWAARTLVCFIFK